MPDKEDRIIQALGLGNNGDLDQNGPTGPSVTPDPTPPSSNVTRRQASEFRCPGTGKTGLICDGPPYNNGKN